MLSTFVLRPSPALAGQVRLVSFFITARLAAQDTRDAFTLVLAEQLAGLLGEPLPPALPEATRDAFLLDLMSRAAGECQRAHERLVLVVDGLDEDRGITAGPDTHSIAGLLPADPPAGMRVIVAGRPDPPIPEDVPDGHPLRDPQIVRRLPPSRYAQGVKRLARQELRSLLRGTAAERHLVGLVAAARGGLTAGDLAELSGISLWEVEDVLLATAGRTFRSRPSLLGIENRGSVYLLAHEEIQVAAVRYFGTRLKEYRGQLHAWADRYRARRWPADTPEYLLSGYYSLLDDFNDLPRMIQCAGDSDRHLRMLEVTGGDAAAVAETRTAVDRIAAEDTPDVSAALTIARHRDELTDRSNQIPLELPAIWAIAGHVSRAQVLATSIGDPHSRVLALAAVAGALAAAGDRERAAEIAGQAEDAAQSLPGSDSTLKVRAYAAVAGALAAAGDRERAIEIAGQAEAVARSPHSEDEELGMPLAVAAGALAAAGERERAAAVVEHAESAARSAGRHPFSASSAMVLAAVASALAAVRQPARAAAVARRARSAVTERDTFLAGRWETEPDALDLHDATDALATAGLFEEAQAAARSFSSHSDEAEALAGLACSLAKAGLRDRAVAVAEQAEEIVKTTRPSPESGTLAAVAGALAAAGLHERAETLADSVRYPFQRARAFTAVAGALAGAGLRERAVSAAEAAEAAARSVPRSWHKPGTIAKVADALAAAGLHEQAAAAAHLLSDDKEHQLPSALKEQNRILAGAVGALAAAGLFERAEAIARTIPDFIPRARALARIAGALAAGGESHRASVLADQAETLIRSYLPGCANLQVIAWAGVAGALAAAGLTERAASATREVTSRVTPTSRDKYPETLTELADELASAGLHEQAEAVARMISEPERKAKALATLSGALAGAGLHKRATGVAGQAIDLAASLPDGCRQSEVLAEVANVLMAVGMYEHAESAIRALPGPPSQWQPRSYAKLAGVLASAGKQERAAAAAGLAEDNARPVTGSKEGLHEKMFAQTMAEAASALASAGERNHADMVIARAEAAARSVSDARAQARVLATLARTLAAAGLHNHAADLAATITHPRIKGEALAAVARALAGAGEYKKAEAIARSIYQARILADIAVVMIEAGYRHDGGRLAAAACAAGSWITAAKPVLLLTPSAHTLVLDGVRSYRS